MANPSNFIVVITADNCTETFDYDSFESAKSAVLDLSKKQKADYCYIEEYNPVTDEYKECWSSSSLDDENVNQSALETVIELDGEVIEIYRYGKDDYSVEMVGFNCKVRGTLLTVIQEVASLIAEANVIN